MKLPQLLWAIGAVLTLSLIWPMAQAAWVINQAGVQVLRATGAVLSAADAMTSITECRPRLYTTESATWQDALAPVVTALRSAALPATPSRATLYASLARLSGDATLASLALQDLSTGGQRKLILAWTLGCALASQGDESAAIGVWAAAGLASALAVQGRLAQDKDDPTLAVIQFARAMEVYQRNPTWITGAATPAETFVELGLLQLKQNGVDSAVTTFKRALTIDPAEVRYYEILSVIYRYSLHQPGEAIAVLEQGLTTVNDPRSRALLLGCWGSYLFEQGSNAEAGVRYQEAFSIDPDSPSWGEWAPWMVKSAVHTGTLQALRAQMLAVGRAGGNPASRAILKAIEQVEKNHP